MEKQAYSEKKVEKNPWLLEDEKPVVSKVIITLLWDPKTFNSNTLYTH